MDFTFGSPAGTFGFYGEFAVSARGEIDLANLLLAHSCEHEAGEMVDEIGTLRQKIAANPWTLTRSEDRRLEAVWGEFELELFSEDTADGTVATHLLVAHDNPVLFRRPYFTDNFELRSQCARPESVAKNPGGYYPVQSGRAPERARVLDGGELARRLGGKPLVAFTGAGLSAAGIPAFSGPGGLQERFPIDDYRFPGAVAAGMIERPGEAAQILGIFHTDFMTAFPTRAHLELARLERQGILRHIISGNIDGLHERAGNRRVHINEAQYFKGSDEGWNWIRQGEVALVLGVGMDADNGLLDYARDSGLQMVVIAPQRPVYMHARDWYVPGRAEEVLPLLGR